MNLKYKLVLITLLISIISCTNSNIKKNTNTEFFTNEEFINGLYNQLDLDNEVDVFRFVFSQLDDEVIVYPTENYYYFNFPTNGNVVWGSIGLSANKRDNGLIYFYYHTKVDKHKQIEIPIIYRGKEFSENEGVFVKKINDFKYSITFENRTVIFKLNDIGLNPPKKAKLLDEELFVGPSFDESGIKFFLIFNNATNKLYWILNENEFVPETFTKYTDDIFIGDRTEFAFYIDKDNNRKILVGAEKLNVLQNNWYDGPFDQMPDNYVYTGQIETKKYIEANYPKSRGKINNYSLFLDREEDSRVAVFTYKAYFNKIELYALVNNCNSFNITKSEFYSCITRG